MLEKVIVRKNKAWSKGFVDGLVYAIQELVLNGYESLATYILLESGIDYQEVFDSQSKSGFQDEIMFKFINETYE